MRVALCISGEIRSPIQGKKYFVDKIRNYDKMDIFMSMWNDTTERGSEERILSTDEINSTKDIFNPTKFETEDKKIFTSATKKRTAELKKMMGEKASNYNRLLPMCYKIKRCDQLRKDYEKETGIKYDLIIRGRTDLYFCNKLKLKPAQKNQIFVPWIDRSNVRTSFVCDWFAFGDSKAMSTYCNFYDSVEHWLSFKKADHIESIFCDHLKSNEIKVNATDDVAFIIRKGKNLWTNISKLIPLNGRSIEEIALLKELL